MILRVELKIIGSKLKKNKKLKKKSRETHRCHHPGYTVTSSTENRSTSVEQ